MLMGFAIVGDLNRLNPAGPEEVNLFGVNDQSPLLVFVWKDGRISGEITYHDPKAYLLVM